MLVGWKAGTTDPRVASFRYRVQAPAAALAARGHAVEVFDPARADDYDQVVFCKSYGPADRELARRVRARGGRIVFDLCDNHLYNPFNHPKYAHAREHIGEMVVLADQVTCSTPTLGAVLLEAYGPRDILVAPDAVEVHLAEPAPARRSGPLRLLWYGSHGSPNAPAGMSDLLLIREELEALAAVHPIVLTVCSNNRAKFDEQIAPLRLPTRYVEWSMDGFGEVLAQADGVLLPTSLNPFTACKTHNRLTTATHAGVPVVATGLESYREFAAYCTLDDWTGGLRRLAEQNGAERRRALDSREVLDRRWTIEAIAPVWEQALGLARTSRAASSRSGLRLHGRLDAVADQSLSGWVYAPAAAGERFEVELQVDGRAAAVVRADQARLDLEKAGLPASCGFVLPAPPPGTNWRVHIPELDWSFADRPVIKSEAAATVGRNAAPLLSPPAARRDVRLALAERMRARRVALEELRAEEARRRGMREAAALSALASGEVAPPETLRRPAAGVRPLLQLV